MAKKAKKTTRAKRKTPGRKANGQFKKGGK